MFTGLVIAVAAVGVGRAADPKPGVPVASLAVVDSEGGRVFVPAAGGGIEALDLATGKPIWRAMAGVRLAGANTNQVFAWAPEKDKPNLVRVLVFDAATGKLVLTSAPIPLPEWGAAVPESAQGRSFRAAARTEMDAVVFVWEARTWYYGGARPSPQIEAAARRRAASVVTIDLATGKVAMADRPETADDFKPGPVGGSVEKVGDLSFQVRMGEPSRGFEVKRTLVASRRDKVLWEREIASTHVFPPPP